MTINAVNHISYITQTKKGNDYRKSNVGLATSFATTSLLVSYDVLKDSFNGKLRSKKALKTAGLAAAAIAISSVFGAAIDAIFNAKRAKKADKNPMSVLEKFERDLFSPKFGIRYDFHTDSVMVENRKEHIKHVSTHEYGGERHNSYSLTDDGNVGVTRGIDSDSNHPFIENDERIKNIVDNVKWTEFLGAADDKNYKFRYDSEKEIVELGRPRVKLPSGFYHNFDSFEINKEGNVSRVSSDRQVKRQLPKELRDGTEMSAKDLYEKYADK